MSVAEARLESGFSLIELLVVVAIIGLLAAIAVPTYLTVQNGARDASAQSDLVNAKTALTAFAAGHDGGVPSSVTAAGTATWASTAVDLVPLGWSRSSGTADIAYAPAAGSSWCLLVTSATGAVFRVTPGTAVVRSGTCPPSP